MDKIRILWVHDTPDEGEPGRTLPAEYQPFFEICFADGDGKGKPVMSLSDFADPLQQMWFAKNTSCLPAEILAVDYDLAKRPSDGIREGKQRSSASYEERKRLSADAAPGAAQSLDVDFDGLLLAVFYATLTLDHPTGFVPMSMQMAKMPTSVADFQDLTMPYLGIDFRFLGKRRSWANIINAGVRSLQNRIHSLYAAKRINVSFRDLNAIIDGCDDESTLRVTSRYCTRRIPVRGLFCDSNDEEEPWKKRAANWAKKVLSSICGDVDRGAVLRGRTIAQQLFDAYVGRREKEGRDFDKLFDDRWRLSELSAREASGQPLDPDEQKELESLKTAFGVRKDKCTKRDRIVDLRTLAPADLVDSQTVRWAALSVLLLLMEHLLRARKDWLAAPAEHDESTPHFLIPAITDADWVLAMFPIPASPVITPFHKDIGDLTQETWITRYLQPRGIKPGHVLGGKSWDGEERFGLSLVDRRILYEMAQDIDVDWATAPEMTANLWGQIAEQV